MDKRNPKHEIRNPKQIRIFKIKKFKTCFEFRNLNFEFQPFMAYRHLSRSIVMQSLYEWDFYGKQTDALQKIVQRNIDDFGPGLEDLDFIWELTGGVTKHLADIDKIIEIQPQIGQKVKAEIDNLRCKLIINQSRTQADIDIGFSMKLICKKYFGIKVHYLGHIGYSNHIWQSIRNRRPVVIDFPNSTLVTNFSSILKQLQRRENA